MDPKVLYLRTRRLHLRGLTKAVVELLPPIFFLVRIILFLWAIFSPVHIFACYHRATGMNELGAQRVHAIKYYERGELIFSLLGT